MTDRYMLDGTLWEDAHPELSLTEPFVRYDPETGRIDTTGEQSAAMNKLERLNPPFWTKLRLLPGVGTPEDHRVVTCEKLGTQVIVERPAAPEFDRLTMGVGEGAKIADLPACRVRFHGPLTGTEDHPGGDYEIGWTVSGTYVVEFDPFPLKAVSVAFTIES